MTGRMTGTQNRGNTGKHGSQLGNGGVTLVMQRPAISHKNARKVEIVGMFEIVGQRKTSGDAGRAER